jgi:F-type H+-transporting ATPase subunit alpha
LTQAQKGSICIYAAIGKKRTEVILFRKFIKEHKIEGNVITIVSYPDDPAGLVYLTPYVAMTVAEYYKNKGKDVLIAFDDLTAHAKYYREISLLAGRFPGRNSYPGDIFYLHSRLLERSGNFLITDSKGKTSEASITCMPVAEMIMGDFSGYIQTNLMAMTDGHLYFDRDYFNQGKRPPVNPFLSVTRVGRQAQTPLLRELSRKITSFMVSYEKMKEFMHFGAELSEESQRMLMMGDKISVIFNQPSILPRPYQLSILMYAVVWAGYWQEKNANGVRIELGKLSKLYLGNSGFKKQIDDLILNAPTLGYLEDSLKSSQASIMQALSEIK